MNQIKTIALAIALFSTSPLWAGGAHDHKPLHGGIVVEASHMDWELVAKPERIVIHVRDHGKKASTAGATAKLTLLVGKEKSEAVLKPAGDDRLEAEGPFKLASGAKLVATVKLTGKAPANVRFVLP
jgi:hypothetical protein